MKLLEYEAKRLLDGAGVLIPRNNAGNGFAPFAPSICKSQVLTGGRGKAGGIRVVHNQSEAKRAIKELLSLEINDHRPRSVLCEELLDIERELYLSLSINREERSIELVAHPHGGIEIESQDSSTLFRHAISEKNIESVTQTAADLLDINDLSFMFSDLVEKLLKCFVKNDATLIEINPLIITSDKKLIAGDCKMTLDDSAAFRHADWDFYDSPLNNNFVTLDEQGTVATIANGAGLAMATVDAVRAAGRAPANFLDIGGAATVETITASFAKIVDFESIDSIVINIFGGIVRCDVVAQAIVEAKASFTNLPPLYIRLSGNRSDEAQQLLSEHGILLYETLESALEASR